MLLISFFTHLVWISETASHLSCAYCVYTNRFVLGYVWEHAIALACYNQTQHYLKEMLNFILYEALKNHM